MIWWTQNVDGLGETKVGGVYKLTEDGKGMYKALGYNEYSKRKYDIPPNCEREGLSDYQKDYFCRDARPEPKLDGLELNKWIENARKDCLQIRDITPLKKGDTLKVLVMDRNLCDTCCEDSVNPGNALFSAPRFFRFNTAIYTHTGGLKGTIKYKWQESEEYKDCSEPYPFEFEIEYKKDCWYPLENGHLPKEDPQGFSDFHYPKPKSWREFPSTTRIGWRGPMLLWSKVHSMPAVYWYER